MKAFLFSLLLTSTLPSMPTVPSGSEIRMVSPDLRNVYAVWLVDGKTLTIKSYKKPQTGAPVKVLFKIDKELKPPFVGTFNGTDVLLQIKEETVSLSEVLSKSYNLTIAGGQVLPEGK